MKRDRYNITIYKNESLALAVALKDKNGTAIDLTNATLTAQCRGQNCMDKWNSEKIFGW